VDLLEEKKLDLDAEEAILYQDKQNKKEQDNLLVTEFLPIINDSKSLGLEFISEDATLQ